MVRAEGEAVAPAPAEGEAVAPAPAEGQQAAPAEGQQAAPAPAEAPQAEAPQEPEQAAPEAVEAGSDSATSVVMELEKALNVRCLLSLQQSREPIGKQADRRRGIGQECVREGRREGAVEGGNERSTEGW
ncbi:hypothetical protein NSK_008314 [Nannochloropsis salina CCMP1776]|uniref:Uncharacterized protein n=1 Tax=Nannochloropsis salina CCMP1776 TaxID=1027361 RepID=A0A4D9CUQ4_9STRA|nr:hypothetical protein NSK_008314 [Nannochloropsis salina CCMP1776]|eukprot:TFJ80348.1 hypothetical protein NSK_008314 [Nannochloropsis salina CCMP1776]